MCWEVGEGHKGEKEVGGGCFVSEEEMVVVSTRKRAKKTNFRVKQCSFIYQGLHQISNEELKGTRSRRRSLDSMKSDDRKTIEV